MFNFDKITFGDWVSINSLFQRAEDNKSWEDDLESWDIKVKVSSVFMRDEDKEFDYSKWEEKKNETYNESNVEEVNNIFNGFLNWRHKFFKNYSDYFGEVKTEEEDKGGPDFGNKFDYGKWQYYLQTYKLCETLNYKPEEVYAMNIHYTFSNLTCLKQIDDEKKRLMK